MYRLLTLGDETHDRIGLIKSWIFMTHLFVVSGHKCPEEVQHIQRIAVGVSAVNRLASAAPARCSHPAPECLLVSRERRRGAHQTDPEREDRAQDPAGKPPHVKSVRIHHAEEEHCPWSVLPHRPPASECHESWLAI